MSEGLTQDLLREAAALAERAEVRIGELTHERDVILTAAAVEAEVINEQIRELQRLSGRVVAQSKTTTSKRKTTSKQRVSLPLLARVAGAVLGGAREPGTAFSVRDVHDQTGGARSGIHDALDLLSDCGAIGRVDSRRVPGAPRLAHYWEVRDREMLSKTKDDPGEVLNRAQSR